MEMVKDSTLINALLPLLVIIFTIGAGVVLLYQLFQKNLYIQKLKNETMKSNHQAELLRSNILAQEGERKHIAQDIHDELGAALSITRMNMVMLEQQSSTSAPGLLPGLQNVRTLVEAAIASMRSISHRLMPPQLEAFGLVKTLEAVTEQMNKTGQIDIQLHASSCPADLPWALSLGLYRIIMELINNTARHSGASQACIEIYQQNDYIVCRYTDNGKGFSPGEISNGLGYRSIDGRINSLHGKFEFCKTAKSGFCAIMSIPVHS